MDFSRFFRANSINLVKNLLISIPGNTIGRFGFESLDESKYFSQNIYQSEPQHYTGADRYSGDYKSYMFQWIFVEEIFLEEHTT